MKLKSFLIALMPLIILSACNTTRQVSTGKEAFTPEMQKIMTGYPEITGFERRAIFLEKLTPEQEQQQKIEIFPGRELLTDCNRYGLQGQMLSKTFQNGHSYFLFNTNGEIYSTKMACPDESKVPAFVTGESVITDYRSDVPLVVYISRYLQVKYCLWKAGDEKSVALNGNGTLASEEALQNTNYFPEKAGYVKHILYLPELEAADEINRKVEIIPGLLRKVDSNDHRLNGTFESGQVEGFGFDYWIFQSDGTYSSTKMNCRDKIMSEKFVSSEKKLMAYNSRLPIVVYTPSGFEVNYKIWETNGKLY